MIIDVCDSPEEGFLYLLWSEAISSSKKTILNNGPFDVAWLDNSRKQKQEFISFLT